MPRFGSMKIVQKFSLVRPRPAHSWGFRGLAALALVYLSAFSGTRADAGVVIDGGPDEMQVRVDNDTVSHVLEALGKNVSLHYRSAMLLDKVIDVSFSGSLRQVVFRILVGFDFVVHYDSQGVEIVVYGESGATPTPPPRIEVYSPRPQAAPRMARLAPVGLNAPPRYAAPWAPSQY